MNIGRTYIQLGDGFEFILERPTKNIQRMMLWSSSGVYDLVEKKWVKYRGSIYKKGAYLYVKHFAKESERPNNLEGAPVLTYLDLVNAGYMFDSGEDGSGLLVRYRFDYEAFKRKRQKANIHVEGVLPADETKFPKDEQESAPMQKEMGVAEHMDQLRELLPKLRAGEISAIEFGDPQSPMGFMSHHRILFLSTGGGFQPCIKEIHRGMLGSGDYLGNADDTEILIRAQVYLTRYLRPTSLREKLEEARAKNPDRVRPVTQYFTVE